MPDKQPIEIIAHVPTEQYGFIEMRGGEDDLEKIEKFYETYSESGLNKSRGNFKMFNTFTGEQILYSEEKHIYMDLDWNVLESGSQFAKSKEKKPFNAMGASMGTGKKYGISPEIIRAIWKANGDISATFGTSLHKALEQFFLYHHLDTGEKNYHLPKPRFLREAVLSFPLKDSNILPEVMVSDVANKRVGQIDALEILDYEKKICNILDYKTDVAVEDNLEKHTWQLSFYAAILEAMGWKVKKILILNYVDTEEETKWVIHELKKQKI